MLFIYRMYLSVWFICSLNYIIINLIASRRQPKYIWTTSHSSMMLSCGSGRFTNFIRVCWPTGGYTLFSTRSLYNDSRLPSGYIALACNAKGDLFAPQLRWHFRDCFLKSIVSSTKWSVWPIMNCDVSGQNKRLSPMNVAFGIAIQM